MRLLRRRPKGKALLKECLSLWESFEDLKARIGVFGRCGIARLLIGAVKEGVIYEHSDEGEQGRACGCVGEGSAVGVRCGARHRGGWEVLLFREDDWGVLPSLLRVASGEAGERSLPCDDNGGRGRGLSLLPALQAGSAFDSRAARGDGR